MVGIRCSYSLSFKSLLKDKIEADLNRSAFCLNDKVIIDSVEYSLSSIFSMTVDPNGIWFCDDRLIRYLIYNYNYLFIKAVINKYRRIVDMLYMEYRSTL